MSSASLLLKHTLIASLVTGTCVIATSAQASPSIQCTADLIGQHHDLSFPLTSDPYSVRAADLEDRFRLKAVMVGSAERIDYVKIYVYYASDDESGLITQAVFRSPRLPDATPIPLGGVQYVYSPYLGHELKYECFLKGDSQ